MSREVHVRFCESGGVQFPSATHRNVYVRSLRAGQRVMANISRFIETRNQAETQGQRGQEHSSAALAT